MSGRDFDDRDQTAAQAVVDLVGRWPLGVCRAGLKLAQQSYLTVAQFAERLGAGRSLVADLDSRDGDLNRQLLAALSPVTPEHRVALARV